MSDPADAHCIKMAKLNLFQCLAVAGPHYEDLFCLGHHAMMDTGQCVISAAGFSEPAPPPMIDRRSGFVPVALAMESATDEAHVSVAPPPSATVPVAAPQAPIDDSSYAGTIQR